MVHRTPGTSFQAFRRTAHTAYRHQVTPLSATAYTEAVHQQHKARSTDIGSSGNTHAQSAHHLD